MRADPRELSPPAAGPSETAAAELPEGSAPEAQHELNPPAADPPASEPQSLGASSPDAPANQEEPPAIPEHPRSPAQVILSDDSPSRQAQEETGPSGPPAEPAALLTEAPSAQPPAKKQKVASRKTTAKEPARPATDAKAAERQAKLQRAAGGTIVLGKTGTSVPARDSRALVSAKAFTSQKLQIHRHSRALAGPSAGFASYRTKSGHSFGSLESFIDKWNDADDEVTSQALTIGPSQTGEAIGISERKFDQAISALKEAKTATKVTS